MRFRILLALSLSIVLIIMASWSRFATADRSAETLSLVERAPLSDEYYNELLKTYLQTDTTDSLDSDPLTHTDLIGRQLMNDYLGLASGGNLNQRNIIALAEKYAESITTLNKTVRINPLDLNVVTETTTNLRNYSQEMLKVYEKYMPDVLKFHADELNGLNEASGYSSAKISGKAYENLSLEIKKIPVPNSLAGHHLELINIYQENAFAMQSIAEMNKDPILALASTIVIDKNADKEELVLKAIENFLKAKNIY